MKLICILLSFVFASVLAIQQADYKRLLYITNSILVDLEEDAVETLVQDLLNPDSECNNDDDPLYDTIGQLVILLVTPDYYGGEAYLEGAAKREKKLLKIIKKNIDISTDDIAFHRTNLTSFGDTRRKVIYPALKNILDMVEGDRSQFDSLTVCYVIALLKSAVGPGDRIENVNYVNSENYCKLTTACGYLSYYRQYSDGIIELESYSGGRKKKLRSDLKPVL